MVFLRSLPAIVMMLGSIATAQGQAPVMGVTPQFADVLRSQQHRDAVSGAARQSTVWIRHACDSASFNALPSLKIWQPVSFDAKNTPVAGVWGESIEVNGCGIDRILNVATVVRSPGVLVSKVLAPGATKADPLLQRDASRYVFAALAKAVQGCRTAYLDDTVFEGEEASVPLAKVTGPVKIEHWIVAACGRTITVEVKFIPVASSTDVVAHVL
jgi:hypothetical protein